MSACGHDVIAEKFVLVRDGTRAVAFTDAHGTWVDWLS